MHERAVVVRRKVVSVLLFELRQKAVVNVSPINSDITVPVASLLFMPQP